VDVIAFFVLIFLLIPLLTVVIFVRMCLSVITVWGHSMQPTLVPGDCLLVLRHWPGKWLRKGQIVVGDLSQVLAAFEQVPVRAQLIERNSGLPWDTRDAQTFQMDEGRHIGSQKADENESNLVWHTLYAEAPTSDPASFKPLPVGAKFVKRVVGLPGDMVVIHISELHESMWSSLQPKCDSEGNLVWHIPPGHYFVRGDAPVGGDSITWGPVHLDSLVGVMLAKLPRRASSTRPPPTRR